MFNNLSNYLTLVRPYQWYKNLVVFFPLIFSFNLFNTYLFQQSLIACIALIFISSSNYIFNDLKDIELDKLNKDKKDRPLAKNLISKKTAFYFGLILLFSALFISFQINHIFFLYVSIIFLVSSIYNVIFRNIVFVDVLTISLLFVLRASAGAAAIGVYVSMWLVVGVFLLALFLALGKRFGELKILGGIAAQHRKVFKTYNENNLKLFIRIILMTLFVIYPLFTYFSEHHGLIVLYPLYVLILVRYYILIEQGDLIIRRPEKIFCDKVVFIGLIIFVIISLLIMYGG